MSASQSDSVQQDGQHATVCGRSMGRSACLTILPLAVLLLIALHDATLALADWPRLTEPIRQPFAPAATTSHQGLGANATVPSWAAGKSIHFFASPGGGFSLGGLTEPNLEGTGEVNPDLGRRCEEGYCPEPPLLYHEGKGVQHGPTVHVIFWGKNWEKAPGAELRTQLLKLYEGISGSTWQGILTQYFDTTGRVSSTVTVSSYIDTGVAAPSSVNDHALREEVANAVKAKGWTREFSSQFVVIPAPGATYTAYGTFTANTTKGSSTLTSVSSFANVAPGERIAGPGIPGVAEVTSINTTAKTATLNKEATVTATGVTIETEGFAHGFCGYHGVDASGSSYTFVAYPGEEPFKKGCISFDPKENADNVTSMIASHEYAESATDPQVEPFANAEWYTSNDYELADICASGDDEITEGSLKGSFVQGLWDDHQSQCSLSDKEPPHVYAVTEPATGLKTHEATLKGIVNPENTETKYYFEYGPTTSYGTKTAEVNVGSGLSNKEAKQTITGLTLEGTYHYRVVATNSTGTTDGEDHTFTLSRWVITDDSQPKSGEFSYLDRVSCTSGASCTAIGAWRSEAGGGETPMAQYWNGTTWETQEIPRPIEETTTFSLDDVSCSASNACTAVGWYYSSKTLPIAAAERWNGTKWALQTVPTPTGTTESSLNGVACWSATSCIATGGTNAGPLAEYWNGTEWTIQTVPSPSGAKSVGLGGISCSSGTACTSVGGYKTSTGSSATLAERWNGTAWSIQTTPNPTGKERFSLDRVSCPSASVCEAVGNSYGVSAGPFVEGWNGTEWTVQTTPTPPGLKGSIEMQSVSCASATSCIVVGGYYITSPSEIPQKSVTLAEFWNGTEWTVQAPENPEHGLNELAGVSCIAAAPETCIAVGSFQTGAITMLAESRIAIKPVVETKPATSVGETGATLNGAVNPEGYETNYYFEYGISSYESKTAEAKAGSGTSKLEKNKAVTGLKPSSTYKVRMVATNGGGTVKGPELSFSTTGKPTVETKEATNIGLTEATLHGIVNPRGEETKYYFEYGTTESYGSKTAEASAGSGSVNLEESKTITGLLENTKYHFRIVATNGAGASKGLDKTFISTPVWTLQSTPNPTGATESVLAGPYSMGTHLACSASTACTSVGMYKNSSGTKVTLAERWNGTEWSIQTTPNPSSATESWLDGVSCPAATTCTAVGFYKGSSGDVSLAEQWNGTEWSIKSTPNPSGGKEVHLADVSCSSTTACTAVGWYENSSSERLTLAERWNGTEWSIQSTPNPEGSSSPSAILHSVSCPSSTVCIAVGDYYGSSGDLVTLAERWNGTEWSIQSTPNPEGETEIFVEGVSCSSSTACTAVGAYKKGSGAILVPLAMRWNGTEWSIQTTTYPSGATENVLIDASCSTATACTAVGEDKNSSGTYVTLVEHWNGTEWAVQASPNPSGAKESELEGISCSSATVCLATGYYQNSAGTNVTLGETYG